MHHALNRICQTSHLPDEQPPPISCNHRRDHDADGVPDAVEDAGPNGGDGDGDGTPDSQQGNVASDFVGFTLDCATSAPATGPTVTMEQSLVAVLRGLRALRIALLSRAEPAWTIDGSAHCMPAVWPRIWLHDMDRPYEDDCGDR
jgi:hypothetical protein